MATYNGAKYIQEQLQSFINQTRQPDELIITDDCSNDQTKAIVLEFAEIAPFKVEFHRNEKKLGYCGNFNAALMKTTGDLVFLSDQDDVWFPEKIEHMAGVAERHPEALVVMNDAALTDGELNVVGLTKIGQIRSAGFSMDSFVMGCCCGIKRELLAMCLPIPDGYKAHDDWIVAFADGLNAKLMDEIPLQYYRRHEANESKFIANRINKVSRTDVFFLNLKNIFKNTPIEHEVSRQEQLFMMMQGIERAKYVVSTQYHKPLLSFLHKTKDHLKKQEQYLESLKKRVKIREKPLLTRSIAAVCFFIQGGYRNASGVKSMVRDIVTPWV